MGLATSNKHGLESSRHSNNPIRILGSLWSNWDLVVQLVKRDVIGRYRGSFAGMFWSFVHPLFMLAVYTFVFGTLFKIKWGGASSTLEFSLVLFSGFIFFNFFAECVSRAPLLVISQPNYVKKVVFPLEILPWVAIGSALFHMGVSLLAWLLFYLFIYGLPSWTVLLIPLILLAFLPVVLGLCWILSALGVYVRDIAQISGLAIQALLFLSPVFFSLETVPENLKTLMLINPLTFIIEQAREVLFKGMLPDFMGLAIYGFIGFCFAWLGFALFQKLRDGFADVI